jgi:hypothetical protein
MQSLAFLALELQNAQQRVRETFAESPELPIALHSNSLSGRAIHNPVVRLAFLNPSFIGTAFSLFVLLLVVLGVIVAACSGEPTLWMLRWPAPLVVIFTVFNFVRQGYHKRDGLLVLGPATEDVPERQIVLHRVPAPRTREFRAVPSAGYIEHLVHRVSDWDSGVAIKMGRRQGAENRIGFHRRSQGHKE